MSDEWPGRPEGWTTAPARSRRRVVVESPYAGDVDLHMRYLRACLLDCLARGESPIASHGLLTQVLDDDDPEQRTAGIEAGWAWHGAADVIAFYCDLGWSAGMVAAEEHARSEGLGLRIAHRRLYGEWDRATDAVDW